MSYAQSPTIATSQRSSRAGRHQVSAIGARRKEHRPPARLPYRVDRLLNREGIILDAIPACTPPLGIDLVDRPIPPEEETARPADNLPERSLKRTPDSNADSWIKDEASLIDKPERHSGRGSNSAARDRVRTLHRQGLGNNESCASVANRGEGILKAWVGRCVNRRNGGGGQRSHDEVVTDDFLAHRSLGDHPVIINGIR